VCEINTTESVTSHAHKLYFIDLFRDVAKITWMEQRGVESGDYRRRFPFGSSGAMFPIERAWGGEVGAVVSHGRKKRATKKKAQKNYLLLFFLVVGDSR